MKSTDIVKAFSEGKLEKKFFWQLMRDKLSALVDYKNLLSSNSACNKIIIDKNHVVLEFTPDTPGGGDWYRV